MSQTISRLCIEKSYRIQHTARLFNVNFPLYLEPCVYAFTRSIANSYDGAYWEFYTLGNGGFYMAPNSEKMFDIRCENAFEGHLSADALGITSCLYAYSHLSFCDIKGFSETCAEHYHLLRAYMFEHNEANKILSATD